MAYRIVKKPFAWWPVSFDIVTAEGKVEKAAFEMHYRLLKVDESADFLKRAVTAIAAEQSTDAKHAQIYADLVKVIADDWRHVEAENGEALSWSDDNLLTMMNEPGMFGHVFEAFRACLSATPEIREGN